MPDPQVPVGPGEALLVEDLVDQAHLLGHQDVLAVGDGDAR